MKQKVLPIVIWFAVGVFDYSAWMASRKADDVRRPWINPATAHVWEQRNRAAGVLIAAAGPLGVPVVFLTSGMYADGFSY